MLFRSVGATETQTSAGFSWTRAVETEEEDSQPAVIEREIEELSILENLVMTTQRKIENTKKRLDNSKKPEDKHTGSQGRKGAETGTAT